MSRIEIRGGAGPYEAAAITAVFRRLLDDALAARAVVRPRRVPPAWTQAYQDPHPDDPLAVVRPERRGPPGK
ncbi:MAG: hypothetical protein ACT4OP_07035 [Actinomycetota bacterium]